MAVKIRLQRHGKKNFAFFHIVVADARAPRDGRYIEQIGSYNPNTNPATIQLNFERALAWIKVGAEPTLTARRILSYKGKVFGVEPPTFVNLQVVKTDPGFKGDTATNTLKPAILETGVEIKVPLFIDEGEFIQIDTRTGEYLGRA